MDAEKDIDQEIAEHKKRIQECDEESSRLAQLINQDLQPTIQELQNQIEMLQESVDSASQQGIIEKIEKHITTPKKTEDGNEDQAAFKAQDNFTAEFVSDFNDLLNTILTEVKFDKFSNCYFDFESEDFDIVVNGKKKQKFGGGYKAFLNATGGNCPAPVFVRKRQTRSWNTVDGFTDSFVERGRERYKCRDEERIV